MKRSIFSLAVLAMSALIGLPALAQAPPPVVFSGIFTQPTYSAAVTGLVPAASATDWFIITGSATKTVVVKEIQCSGISTANASQLVRIAKRSTAATGGTGVAQTAVPHTSTDGAATAVVTAYTANPTVGTLVGYLRNTRITTGPAASATVSVPTQVWSFGNYSAMRPVILNGVAQGLAVNGNGASYSAGTAFDCSVTWTEF